MDVKLEIFILILTTFWSEPGQEPTVFLVNPPTLDKCHERGKDWVKGELPHNVFGLYYDCIIFTKGD